MNGSINNFLEQNAWSILISIVAVSIAWATLTARINAVEVRAQENKNKTQELVELTERLIVLEERERNLDEKVDEIRADIKDIKAVLNAE